MQDDAERARLKTTDNKIRSKRTKQRSSSSPLNATANTSGERLSVTSKVAAPMTNQNCDNLTGGQPFSSVPYANTKNGQADAQNNNTLLNNGSALDVSTAMHSLYNETLVPETGVNANIGTDFMAQRPDTGLDGKLPIPRLPKSNNKQTMQNYMSAPFASPYVAGAGGNRQQMQHQSPVPVQKQKYKPIKPKPNMNETVGLKNDEQPPIVSDENGALKSVVSAQKGGNDAIIGCLEKDALDDYLHGGSNSQEQEEELMQYFPQQSTLQQSMQGDSTNSLDKISQLRRLLERNMNQEASGKAPQYQNGLSAAASLSLMSQRSQQKHALIPPTSLTCQHNSARRVSFEVPCDPDSAASSIPPSPNTKQRFSFTPISPRPYSPTKSSSANASPFVSPRNTPIPRRMSTQPTTTFMQSSASTMYSGKPLHKANLPRTIMRSMSVNSETCALSPFQAVHHRPFMSSMKSTDNSNHMNVDVKPDVSSLQDLGNPSDCQGNVYSPAWNHTSQSLTAALPPLQVPRSQYQVSMSAPQSPVVHYSKSVKKNVFNFRKESRAHSFDMESSNLLLPSVDFKNQPDLPSCHSGTHMQTIPDKYSDEIGELFPEEDVMMPHLSSVQGMSTFRSQSVPLRRMVNSAAVSPMPATALPSPHYGAPQNQHSYFNFNQYTPGSSVAPTPVPSEVADFGVESEGIHSSPAPAPGSLQDLHDGLTSDGINPDILNEMFSMFEDGKADGQQASQDFPQTPEQYKPDPETTLRGDPLFSSFRLQAVGSECGPGSCSEDQLSLSATQSTITNSADPILNELNSMTNPGNTQPVMDSLMEDAPSSFMTDDLESEISQLTREVGNSNS